MVHKKSDLYSPSWAALLLRCIRRSLLYLEAKGDLHPIHINKRGERRYKGEEIQKIIDENPWIWKPHIEKLNKLIASKKS
jgi:hypothetical protein